MRILRPKPWLVFRGRSRLDPDPDPDPYLHPAVRFRVAPDVDGSRMWMDEVPALPRTRGIRPLWGGLGQENVSNNTEMCR